MLLNVSDFTITQGLCSWNKGDWCAFDQPWVTESIIPHYQLHPHMGSGSNSFRAVDIIYARWGIIFVAILSATEKS